jgi:excinuclease UvrABC ATPase subunit
MTDLDHIQVRGARENNLRGVSVDIPKRAITVFTGVSGSGKSSLVFGTIAAESQRLINETYTAFLQSLMPAQARPDVDTLRNLSAAILVDQERMGANSRSTVGTATDAYSMLRVIYSRLAEPYVGHSSLFSFNDPQGMCPACEGMGRVSSVDVDAMVDRSRSLNEGAITLPNFGVDSWQWRMFAESGHFDADKRLADYTDAEWEQFLRGPEERVEIKGLNLKYEGLIHKFERTFLSKDVETAQPHIRAAIERVATFAPCPECGGARLNQAALAATIGGRNIAECAAMQVDDLARFLAGIDAPNVAPALDTLRHTLDSLVEVGLGYLSLDRESATLSGGEAQRVKMVRHLGSSLSDVTYVFDEPTMANGVKPALFSANSAGACPACKGNGVIYTDLAFMAGVVSVCEACEGKRFTAEVLGYRLRGANIADVLDMSVEEASGFFTERAVRPMLGALADVGLGYVRLGQPLTTLSGGERQRIKLAIEVDRASDVLVLDEPTTGLHMADVDKLVDLLDDLVDRGRTLIVIEHDLDVVAAADWVIDIGPGAGHDGGTVVFAGPPRALVDAEGSLTGRHLKEHLA